MRSSNVQYSSLKQQGDKQFDSGVDALAFQDDPGEERLLERNLALKPRGCCSSAHDCMEPFYFGQDFTSPATSRSSSLFSTLDSSSFSSKSELEMPAATLPTSYGLHAMHLPSTACSDTSQKLLDQQFMEYNMNPLFEKSKKFDENQIREDLLGFREYWKGSSNWDSDVENRICHEDIPRDKPLTLLDWMNQEKKLELLSQDLIKCDRADDHLSSKDDIVNQEILLDGTVDFYAVGKGRIWEHSKSYHEKPKQISSDLCDDDLFPVYISPNKIERVRNMETEFSHQRSLSSSHADYSPPSLGECEFSDDELTKPTTSITKGHHKDECENGLNNPRTPSFNRTDEILSRKISSAVKPISSRSRFRRSTSLDNLRCETSCDMLSKARFSGLTDTGIDKQLKKGSEAVLVLASENACRTDDTRDTSLARGKIAAMALKRVSKRVSNRAIFNAIKKLFAGTPSSKNENVSPNVTPDVRIANVPIECSNSGCLHSKMSSGSRKLATASPVKVVVNHSVSRNCIAGTFAVHSRLYCSDMDGVPSYAFIMEDCRNVLIAKVVGATSCDGDLTYVFYSWKNHGNTKVNWENWNKFENVELSFVGKMKASCRFREEANTCKSEAKQYMHLEFVILEGGASVAINATPSNSSKRILYSSWERSLQPQISPVSSPNPIVFGSEYNPSIYSGSAVSPRVSSRLVPLRMVTRRMASTPKVHKIGTATNFTSMHSLHCTPPRTRNGMNTYSDHHSRSCPRQTEETHSELAAVVIRFPCNKSTVLGSSTTPASNSNVVPILKYLNPKRIDNDRRLETLSEDFANSTNIKSTLRGDVCPRIKGMATVSSVESQIESRTELELDSDNAKVRCGMQDQHFQTSSDLSSITVILPAGDHGRPMKGSCGPMPLIDRWRSGGKCDCGSWDLGCGLTILNAQPEEAPKSAQQSAAKSETSNNFPTICFQVRKQEGVWMSLARVREGLFAVGFKAPITPLQAFASAVAVLHSRKLVFVLTKHDNWRTTGQRQD